MKPTVSTSVASPAQMSPKRIERDTATTVSSRQLERIEELNHAFNAGEDWSHFYDLDAELHTPPEWLDQSVYRGHDGLREVLRLWTESFDEYHWSQERLIDGDNDVVVGLYFQRGRIKGVDSWIDQPIGCVWRFRGELIARLDVFFSWEAAIDAAGVTA
jgi:ketosteroid isomerase-like protein